MLFEFSTDHIIHSDVPCGGPWDVLRVVLYCATVLNFIGDRRVVMVFLDLFLGTRDEISFVSIF